VVLDTWLWALEAASAFTRLGGCMTGADGLPNIVTRMEKRQHQRGSVAIPFRMETMAAWRLRIERRPCKELAYVV
jgi:hypothetical protein